jgi:hypothetical protein
MIKRFREWLRSLKATKMKWYPSPEFLAQSGHVLLGIVAVVWPFALWGKWYAALTGTVGILGYMLVKEFSFDLLIEGDTVETGWKDTAYLAGGILVAWLSLWAKGVL